MATKINPQIKIIADTYNRKIDKAKSNLALAVRQLSTVDKTVRRVEVDRATGQITEAIRHLAHPFEIARAVSVVDRCKVEIARLMDQRDLAIMDAEIIAEDKATREGARRAREKRIAAAVEEGTDRTIDEDDGEVCAA